MKITTDADWEDLGKAERAAKAIKDLQDASAGLNAEQQAQASEFFKE